MHGQTPFYLLHGYEPTPYPSDVANTPGLTEERLEQLAANRDKAIIAHKRGQEAMIARKPGLAYKKFEVGDKVWLDAHNLHLKTTRKLTPRRLRPFEVIEEISPVVYKLRLPKAWHIHDVFHTSLLTPQRIRIRSREHSPAQVRRTEKGNPLSRPVARLLLSGVYMGTGEAFKECPRGFRGLQVLTPTIMSSLYDASTSFDALDDTTYDVFDVDAYVNSLSPSISTSESVRNTPVPAPRLKRYPKTRSHPHPSPAVVSPPAISTASAVATTSTIPVTASTKPDKGKGRQHAAIASSPTGPMDATPSPIPTASAELTPEQHVCIVQMLKCLDEWLAQGWQPGVDESRLQNMAEIFNSAETVAEGSLSNIRRADLAWRLADSEGWEKSAGSSIMGAINIQVTVTKILYKDYGDSLIASFRSFLGRKEIELGDGGRPTGISGPSLQKETGRGNPRPDVQKRVRFEGLDGPSRGTGDIHSEWNEGSQLLVGPATPLIPSYDEACETLARHLAFISGTPRSEWNDFLLALRDSAAGTNALRSKHATSQIPDGLFAPVATGNQLRYLLAGRGQVTDTHPLGGYRCFRCDSLGHWSADHDQSHRSVYGGPPHSGVFPDSAR